jgi:hypothetical protein
MNVVDLHKKMHVLCNIKSNTCDYQGGQLPMPSSCQRHMALANSRAAVRAVTCCKPTSQAAAAVPHMLHAALIASCPPCMPQLQGNRNAA